MNVCHLDHLFLPLALRKMVTRTVSEGRSRHETATVRLSFAETLNSGAGGGMGRVGLLPASHPGSWGVMSGGGIEEVKAK